MIIDEPCIRHTSHIHHVTGYNIIVDRSIILSCIKVVLPFEILEGIVYKYKSAYWMRGPTIMPYLAVAVVPDVKFLYTLFPELVEVFLCCFNQPISMLIRVILQSPPTHYTQMHRKLMLAAHCADAAHT